MGRTFAAASPGEHWTRKVFRQCKFPLGPLAARMGCSTAKLSMILSGRIAATPEEDKKLEDFALQVFAAFQRSDDPRTIRYRQKLGTTLNLDLDRG